MNRFQLDYKPRFHLDYNIIKDKEEYESYELMSFIDAEKLYNILCFYELKLILAEKQVKSLQYRCDYLEHKVDLIDDFIIKQIAEYHDNSYTPAGTTKTITANNKIEALKKFKDETPFKDLHKRNKVDALLELRKDYGLMSSDDWEEFNKKED